MTFRRNFASSAYIALVIGAGAVALAHGFQTWSNANRAMYLSWSIIALVASGMKVSLPSVTGTMSMNFVFVLIGLSEFSVGETLLTGCLGVVVQSIFYARSRPKPVQLAFNIASVACSIEAAYAVQHALRGQSGVLVAATFFLANTLFVATVIALTEGKNVWIVWRDSYFWSFPNYLVGAAAAWVVGFSSRVIGWQPSLLLMPILYVVYRSHRMYVGRLEEARESAERQRAHAEEVAALHRRTIETLALAIEAKDQTTHDHLERVETYAVEVGKELGLGDTEIEALRAAALLHDIGKLAVPEYIISKPGKLTPEEFEKMKTHTVVGAEMVERIRFPYAVAPMVRGHHEKWNGTGYPDGLAGERIPIGARILAAVDCLDALASDRQYRRALPLHEAIKVVEAEAGKSFDARVVEILARRCFELAAMVSGGERIARLSTDVKIERGDAPAAGFEKAAPADQTSRDLLNLHESLVESSRRSETLANLTAALARCGERDAIHATLQSSLRCAVAYDVLALYLRHEECLIPEWIDGGDFKLFASSDIPVGMGLSGWVAENGKAIVNGNPAVEPGYLNDPARFSALRSALAVPLISTGGIAGVLSLYRTDSDAFTTGDLATLTSVSATLTSALERTLPDPVQRSSPIHAGA
jgi:putative nucleotidyltransferase with HDIG domain